MWKTVRLRCKDHAIKFQLTVRLVCRHASGIGTSNKLHRPPNLDSEIDILLNVWLMGCEVFQGLWG